MRRNKILSAVLVIVTTVVVFILGQVLFLPGYTDSEADRNMDKIKDRIPMF